MRFFIFSSLAIMSACTQSSSPNNPVSNNSCPDFGGDYKRQEPPEHFEHNRFFVDEKGIQRFSWDGCAPMRLDGITSEGELPHTPHCEGGNKIVFDTTWLDGHIIHGEIVKISDGYFYSCKGVPYCEGGTYFKK